MAEIDALPHERQIVEYQQAIAQLKKHQTSPASDAEVKELEKHLTNLKKKVYSGLTPWEKVSICRHPKRPHALDYIRRLCENFIELAGDRLYADDHAIVGGIGVIDGQPYMIIGQEKGHDIDSRIHHNFGMAHPEGYRKALRLMKMAAKFNLPVLTLIDTSGAYPALTAEERGQGWAIAANLLEMARLPTPIIIVIIGEAASGGALAVGIGDSIGMLEHAYYSAITPEGCASILWKDVAKAKDAATTLQLTAQDVKKLEIIDTIIQEPEGGAHHDPEVAFRNVKAFIIEEYKALSEMPKNLLLERRYEKFRKLGAYETATTSDRGV